MSAGKYGKQSGRTQDSRGQAQLDFGLGGHIASANTRVGAGLKVQFFFTGGDVVEDVPMIRSVWSPRLPTKSQYKRVAARYGAARGIFLAELVRRLERNFLTVDGVFSDGATK